jgi:hypothetical protein
MALGLSLLITAVGAILRYAYTPTHTHGFHLGTIGAILMIVGIVGAVASVVDWGVRQYRLRRPPAGAIPPASPPVTVERADVEPTPAFRREWERVREPR